MELQYYLLQNLVFQKLNLFMNYWNYLFFIINLNFLILLKKSLIIIIHF